MILYKYISSYLIGKTVLFLKNSFKWTQYFKNKNNSKTNDKFISIMFTKDKKRDNRKVKTVFSFQ